MNAYVSSRVTRAQKRLQENSVDALIVTSTANFYYFTEMWIDPHERLLALVIPKASDPVIIAPALHEEDFKDASIETVLWTDGTDTTELLAKHLPESGVISIDNLWPSANLIALMRHRSDLTMLDSTATIAKLRLHKDEREQDLLRRAGKATDSVMESLFSRIRPGMTELDVEDELRSLWEQEGVTSMSFSPIIAAGSNGASPHHQTGSTKIEHGDMLVIDMGGKVAQYCSDITRTVAVGDVSAPAKAAYDIVLRAQSMGVAAVKSGIPVEEIDITVRKVIEDAGYGKYFVTRTGHGLGIEIHEEPYVYEGNQQTVEPGMVFSIEPGIYLPGQFGIRIEDVVIATDNGCENLYGVTKELQVVGG